MLRLSVAVLLTGAVLSAASASQEVTIAQLTAFMRTSISNKLPDKEVADYVVHMKLSQKLDPSLVEELQSEGLGPKTIAALKQQITLTANMAAPVVAKEAPKPTPIPPPSYEESQQVISDMTDYALNYTKGLPDFLCTQVTRRYADPRFRDSWISLDTVIAKLSYQDGHEDYEVKLVNDTMVQNKSMEALNGAISTGEFGSMMYEIFEPRSGAEFHFERWGTLRKQRVYVFSYAIEQNRSRYSIEFDKKQRIVAAYKGLVYVSKASHKITRITAEAVDMPPDFPVRAASSIIDYDMVAIGPSQFMLPVRAEARLRDSEAAVRNDIEFRSYRKFGAESEIRYDDIPDAAPAPKEEAPKPDAPKPDAPKPETQRQ